MVWSVFSGSDVDARRMTWLLLVFLIVVAFLESLYYVEGRHRWAVEPMLLVLSGAGAGWLLRRRPRSA